jgi:hypothetical protein
MPSGAPSAAPSGAASTSPSPSASLAAEDFVPTRATLSIDGTEIPLQAKGNFGFRESKQIGVSFGVFKGEAPTPAHPAIPTVTIVSNTKALSAPDFTEADTSTLNVGITWLKGFSLAAYGRDESATVTLANVGGKLNLSYQGKMKRLSGTADFPESIAVNLAAEGIPAPN